MKIILLIFIRQDDESAYSRVGVKIVLLKSESLCIRVLSLKTVTLTAKGRY